MLEFLQELTLVVAAQVIAILGIFFILGFILHLLQKATLKNYTQSVGWRGLYLTAWIGTPIHEIGHIFFIKVFRHRLEKVSLFHPNKDSGGLGHVEHSYNKKSIYQLLGLFFIGTAPMICGLIILSTLLYILVPNGKEVITTLLVSNQELSALPLAFAQAGWALFSWENIQNIWFWLFLYISFCVVSHMAPSGKDRKHMWKGLFYFLLLLLIANIIPLLLGIEVNKGLDFVYRWNKVITALFLYAILLSSAHYFLTALFLRLPFRLFKKR